VDAINTRASESAAQRELADTEANLKQAKDEAARATKEAQQARADAQSERQSAEANLKQAKDEAARATKEAQQAKADDQAAQQSKAEAERKLTELEAARTATEEQKRSQTDPLGTWLRGLGTWIRHNAEAVYSTERGLGFGYFDGPTALSPDRKTLYLYLFGLPLEFVVVKGLTTPVARARVVGTGTQLDHQRVGGLHKAAGWEYVFVDHSTHAADMDPYCTVIACEFDEPLELAPTDIDFD